MSNSRSRSAGVSIIDLGRVMTVDGKRTATRGHLQEEEGLSQGQVPNSPAKPYRTLGAPREARVEGRHPAELEGNLTPGTKRQEKAHPANDQRGRRRILAMSKAQVAKPGANQVGEKGGSRHSRGRGEGRRHAS